jgi:hypothetical protein
MALLKKGSKGSEVKKIQKLLNSRLKPSPKLSENGDFDAATEEAVKAFQKQERLKPDGIVGKNTLGALSKDGSGGASKSAGVLEKPADAHTSRSSFVDSKVKENALSKAIIDKIYPYFPKKYKVISAYLSASDLYWKVNYHWDAMRVWLEYAKDHEEMKPDEKKQLDEFYKRLMSNKPSKPGHFKVNKIGEPEDASSEKTIEQRCTTLQKLKKELAAYSSKQQFAKKKMKQQEVLKYALNPLALPKKSNHVHGWALDIAGDINGAAEIAKKLGATLAFKEMTHCHCEFKNGAKLPKGA